MSRLISGAVSTIVVTSLALAIGERTGVITVNTKKISNPHARSAATTALSLSHSCVDWVIDLTKDTKKR